MTTDNTTKKQKFYRVNGQIKAVIDVYLTSDLDGTPSIAECRHAVLPLAKRNQRNAYVIYDRLLNRIVDGVYYVKLEAVLAIAQHYNEYEHARQDMSPNGAALDLFYPKVNREKTLPVMIYDEEQAQ